MKKVLASLLLLAGLCAQAKPTVFPVAIQSASQELSIDFVKLAAFVHGETLPEPSQILTFQKYRFPSSRVTVGGMVMSSWSSETTFPDFHTSPPQFGVEPTQSS